MVPAGTDHQRIAKLDRENEVAPPPKVAPSVGRVSTSLLPDLPERSLTFLAGYPKRSSREGLYAEGRRPEDQREAYRHPGLRVWKGCPQSPDPGQARAGTGCQTSGCVQLLLSLIAGHVLMSSAGSDIGKKLEGPKKT